MFSRITLHSFFFLFSCLFFEAETDPKKKEDLYNKLVERSYEKGKAIEAAAHLEIDAVIDPADTRKVILKALKNKFI